MQYFLSLENYTLYHPLSLLLHLGYLNVLSMALDAIIESPFVRVFDSIFRLLCAVLALQLLFAFNDTCP